MEQRMLSSVLLVLLLKYSHTLVVRSAVCLITRQPAMQTLAFAQMLAQDAAKDHLDVFIAIDNNWLNVTSLNIASPLRFIQIPNEQCRGAGFHLTIHLPHVPAHLTAWDKALYYFSVLNRNHSFVWLIEDDVFIPSTRALLSLHRLYSTSSDLVIAYNIVNRLGLPYDWHWRHATGKFPPPWSRTMANMVGLSRRMLNAIEEFVRWRGFAPFHEYFFNTLALHLNLTMVTPTELSTLGYLVQYPFDSVRRSPNNFFHPVKDLQLHDTWRQQLINESSQPLPTIDVNYLSTLCYKNQSMERTKKYLTELLPRFDQVKGALPPSTRRSLRVQFSAMHERCNQSKASAQVVALIQQLANHAYKLPEGPVGDLVRHESRLHLQLQGMLVKNKADVLRLEAMNGTNASEIANLRGQAEWITGQLTSEIQREVKEQEEAKHKTGNAPSTRPPLPTSKSTVSSEMEARISFLLSKVHQAAKISGRREELKTILFVFFVPFVILVAFWFRKIDKKTLVVLFMLCVVVIAFFYLF